MNWLTTQSRIHPEKKFINHLTFREVYLAVERLCTGLVYFTQDQNRVALLSTNSTETALFFLALQRLNLEVLMLNTRLSKTEIQNQLDALDITVVFTNQDAGFISYARVFSEVSDGGPIHEDVRACSAQEEDRVAVIMNTSASTGAFKSVGLRLNHLQAHVMASQERLGVDPDDNWLLVLPMFHIGGLAILLRSLYNGTRVTILRSFDPDTVLHCIETERITLVSLVPSMLNRLISKLQKNHLRVVLLGGEFIPDSLVHAAMDKKIPVFKTYGMTETCSQMTTLSVLQHPEKKNSVGLPLQGIQLNIAQPDSEGVGEILVKGPMVIHAYYGQNSEDGWLHTEDIGYLDSDGFLHILDRRENIIISGGENIYPAEIEQLLYAHPAIEACAVVGKPDSRWGKVPVLFAVTTMPPEDIQTYLSENLAAFKLPAEIIILDALPQNSTGKLVKKKLRELLL